MHAKRRLFFDFSTEKTRRILNLRQLILRRRAPRPTLRSSTDGVAVSVLHWHRYKRRDAVRTGPGCTSVRLARISSRLPARYELLDRHVHPILETSTLRTAKMNLNLNSASFFRRNSARILDNSAQQAQLSHAVVVIKELQCSRYIICKELGSRSSYSEQKNGYVHANLKKIGRPSRFSYCLSAQSAAVKCASLNWIRRKRMPEWENKRSKSEIKQI